VGGIVGYHQTIVIPAERTAVEGSAVTQPASTPSGRICESCVGYEAHSPSDVVGSRTGQRGAMWRESTSFLDPLLNSVHCRYTHTGKFRLALLIQFDSLATTFDGVFMWL
jgi:hypothetical protein